MESLGSVRRGIGLLVVYVLCTSLTLGKRCVLFGTLSSSLEQESGYLSSIYCNTRRGLLDVWEGRFVSRVEIDFVTSQPMNGWEFTIQFATKTDLQVSKLRGGQLVVVEYPDNGTVTFRDREALLKADDSFYLTFWISYAQENTRLFPATVHLDEPSPIRTDGMCNGNIVQSPSTNVTALRPRSKSRYRITMTTSGHSNNFKISCRLSFAFPVQLLVLHHAEFLGSIERTEYVIALNGPSGSNSAVVEYEQHNVRDGYAYLHTLCRTCGVDTTKTLDLFGSGDYTLAVSEDLPSSSTELECQQDQTEKQLRNLILDFILQTAVPLTGREPHFRRDLSLTSIRWAARNMFAEADKNLDNLLSYNEIMQYSASLTERNFVCSSILIDRCPGRLTETDWLRCLGVQVDSSV